MSDIHLLATAANEVERLTRENERLRAALNELDAYFDFGESITNNEPIIFGDASGINDAFSRAREALAHEQTASEPADL